MTNATPERTLSRLDATLLVMGGIIGIGIFFTPHTIAERVPHPGAFLLMWVFGGAIAMCAAFTFAELGGTFPHSGGWFVFLLQAFGPFPAFLFAWVVLFVISTGALAGIIRFFTDMLNVALPGWIGPAGSSEATAIGMGTVLGITLVAMSGVKRGAMVQNLCLASKLVVITGLVVGGLALAAPAAETATAAAVPGGTLARGMLSALLPVFFTYGGWQLLCYVAPAVRDPEKTLPRAIIGGVLAVIAIYLLANLAFLRALGRDGIAADGRFAATIARLSFGPLGERLLAAGMAVSALGICIVNVMVSPWLYVAMARERLFFSALGRLHPATGAPVNALILQAVIVLMYFHLSTLTFLVDAVVFVEWIFHGLVALALLKLRRVRADLPRPFRSPAYPLAPIVYGLTAIVVVSSTLLQAENDVRLSGLAVVAAGAFVYHPWRAYFAGRS